MAALFAFVGGFLAGASTAHAHGRPPSLQRLVFDPARPEHIVAQATWGLVSSDDGGRSWSWTCAAAYGVDARSEDPPVARAPDGALVLATYGGLVEDAAGAGCVFEVAPGAASLVASDLREDGRGGLLAPVSDGVGGDRLWRRLDGRWRPYGEPVEDVVLSALRVAPSDPSVVYVSGQRPRRPGQERALFVYRSTDGGRTVAHRSEVRLRGEEYDVHVAAVAPSDPSVVFAIVRHFEGEATPERLLRSDDGAASFLTRLTLPQIGGVVARGGGEVVYAGSKLGGLWRSADGGAAWVRVQDVAVRCLHARDDELWVCTDPSRDGTALAVTRDGGRTLEPVLDLSMLAELRACPACSDVAVQCPRWAASVAYDWSVAASPSAEDAGPPLPERPAPLPEACGGPGAERSGCAVEASPWGGAEALWALQWLRGRRRRSRAKATHATSGAPDAPAAT